jgi:hypothetical protein
MMKIMKMMKIMTMMKINEEIKENGKEFNCHGSKKSTNEFSHITIKKILTNEKIPELNELLVGTVTFWEKKKMKKID